MGSRNFRDFVLDSNGHCFFCLENVSYFSSFKLEHAGKNASPIFSLQSLSSYLELDMSKVFNENVPTPPQLLAKVKESKLKANLCKSCGSLAEGFSELYLKLVKLQIEVTSQVNLIHGKLLVAEKTGLAKRFQGGINSADGLNEKLGITDRLRKETLQKCSRKLGTATPRIRIHKLKVESRFKNSTLGKRFPLQDLANHPQRRLGQDSPQLSNVGNRHQKVITSFAAEINTGAQSCDDLSKTDDLKMKPFIHTESSMEVDNEDRSALMSNSDGHGNRNNFEGDLITIPAEVEVTRKIKSRPTVTTYYYEVPKSSTLSRKASLKIGLTSTRENEGLPQNRAGSIDLEVESIINEFIGDIGSHSAIDDTPNICMIDPLNVTGSQLAQFPLDGMTATTDQTVRPSDVVAVMQNVEDMPAKVLETIEFNLNVQGDEFEFAVIACRSIRVGTYKVTGYDAGPLLVTFTPLGIKFTLPYNSYSKNGMARRVNVCIPKQNILSIRANLTPRLRVIFLKTDPIYATWIREALGLDGNPNDDQTNYYCPLEGTICQRTIILLPESLSNGDIEIVRRLYADTLNEIGFHTANKLLTSVMQPNCGK